MRLSENQRAIICEEFEEVFGRDATLLLFGSRLNDNVRGGDIDLHIDADGSPSQLLEKELALYARLQRRLGERRIDIIVHNKKAPLRPIDKHAQETGITLE